MADVKGMIRDPEFQALPWAERHALLEMKDPEYAALPKPDQTALMVSLKSRDFWKPSALAHEAKPAKTSFRKKAADFLRPTLEAGGTMIGEAIGLPFSPVTAGASIPTMGGLGYASGSGLADVIEGKPTTLAEMGSDWKTGAEAVMGGRLVGAGIGAGIRKAPAALAAIKAPLQNRAQGQARETLSSLGGLSAQEAKNVAQGQSLTSKLGVKLTPAQMSGKPSLSAMEQGLATADPEFAGALTAQDTSAKQVALSRIRQSTGKGKPLPAAPDLATTGQSITKKLDDTLTPIKAAERELWAKVPDYPIPSNNFDEAANAIRRTPMEADTEAAVNKIIDFAARMPKTTQGMQSIERTIGEKMAGGDPNVRRILGDLKKAIGADFKAMGDAADAGDIAIFEGKVVNPAKLRAERDTMLKRISEETALADASPDIPTITAALRDAGDPPNQWMKQVNETAQQYSQRLVTRYNAKIGATTPTLSAEPPAGVVAAKERIASIDAILEGSTPAEDVATAYNAAKDFSRTQKFDRFGKGAVSRVLQKGNEASGLRTADENVGRQFFTPSGSVGLVKALGGGEVGKSAAKVQMKPFVMADMLKAAAPDGVNYNVQSGINYIQKNRAVLERLGLVEDARAVLKDQIPAEMERILAKRAPDAATGLQFFTAQDMRGILQKYGNTIKQLYGTETLTAFRDYNQLMGMIERKNVVPRGGNSNTAEKAMNVANLMIKESVGPAKKLTDGLVVAIAKGATSGGGVGYLSGGNSTTGAGLGAAIMAGRQMLANADSQVAKAFVKILQDAILNPQVAKDVMILQRTGKVPASLQAVIDRNLLGAAALGSQQQP